MCEGSVLNIIRTFRKVRLCQQFFRNKHKWETDHSAVYLLNNTAPQCHIFVDKCFVVGMSQVQYNNDQNNKILARPSVGPTDLGQAKPKLF